MKKNKETEIKAALRAGLLALDVDAIDDELFEEQRGLFLSAVEGVDPGELGPILEEVQSWRENFLAVQVAAQIEEQARSEIGFMLGGAKLAGVNPDQPVLVELEHDKGGRRWKEQSVAERLTFRQAKSRLLAELLTFTAEEFKAGVHAGVIFVDAATGGGEALEVYTGDHEDIGEARAAILAADRPWDLVDLTCKVHVIDQELEQDDGGADHETTT